MSGMTECSSLQNHVSNGTSCDSQISSIFEKQDNSLHFEASEHGFSLQPILFSARTAHSLGQVVYQNDGTVELYHPRLEKLGHTLPVRIPIERQYPLVRTTFDDLNKAVSQFANSPPIEKGMTLRQLYDRELEHYENLVAQAYSLGKWEPDYGTYVFDHHQGNLYLVAPEFWHRLALVSSNGMLLTNPQRNWSWREVRQKLESTVVGFAGASLGGNVLEGWLREARPKRVKVADPDWVEITNFNRGERMSIRHAAQSRACRNNPRDPYDTPRVAKAEYIAYEQLLVDPYTKYNIYSEGITRENIDRFLLGDGKNEPKLDILVEEMDDLELKVFVRERARVHGIDVFMASDMGNRAYFLWNYFSNDRNANLTEGITDEELMIALKKTRGGTRNDIYRFVEHLCGPNFADPPFLDFWEEKGEQPTASLPQSGATAMASGAIGGKELALYVLGHNRSPNRSAYDLLSRKTNGSVDY